MARPYRPAMFRPLLPYLALACFLAQAVPQCAAQETFSFRHLTTEDGLSGDSVYCMLQDKHGYLWLGTFSGLSRYDGSRVVVYRPVPGDAESLSSSLIFDIHEDATGTLWIATDGGGLARYSRDSDAFDRFVHVPGNVESPGSDRMFAVCDDPYGWIWVGTADAGIDRMDTVKGTSVRQGRLPPRFGDGRGAVLGAGRWFPAAAQPERVSCAVGWKVHARWPRGH